MDKKGNRVITFRSFFIILIVISIFFLWSVSIRSDWFGILSKENHQWLTASTIKFVQNWLDENPFKLYFLQLENPNSIEFRQLPDRGIYLSYPAGAILPVYAASLLNSGELSAKIPMTVNLFNQYLISMTLAGTLFLLLLKVNVQRSFALLMGLFSGISYIFLPGNLYWHQNTYYADQAVMLPFILFISIEVTLKYIEVKPSTAKFLKILQYAVAFYGGLCDYLFYCVGLVVFMKRVLFKEFGDDKKAIYKNILTYALPFVLALSTLALQVIFTGGVEALMDTFLQRTGISEAGAESTQTFLNTFWFGHIVKFYGISSSYIILAASGLLALFFLLSILTRTKNASFNKLNQWVKKTFKPLGKAQVLLEFAALVLLPCLLQIYLLKNHSAIHSFSTLKLSLFLSAIPFIIIPVLLSLLKFGGKLPPEKVSIIFTTALILNTFYLSSIYPIHKNLFSASDDYSAELFIKHNTSYEDIVFSSIYNIPENPPQQLAYSEKRVYQVDSIEQIAEKVNGIEGDYNVNIFVNSHWNEDENTDDAILQLLIDIADNTINQDSYALYEISKNNLLTYINP